MREALTMGLDAKAAATSNVLVVLSNTNPRVECGGLRFANPP
jgi:hypothetical protein